MIQAGLTLMIAGMGVVFLFLTIMVLVMNGTAAFFKKYAHLFPEEAKPESHITQLASDDSAEIAVVVAAIKAYNS